MTEVIEVQKGIQRPSFTGSLGWIFLTLGLLVFFTLTKLPEDRIKRYIDGHLASFFAERGIRYTAQETKMSFLLGLSYSLQDVMVNMPSPYPSVHIDSIRVNPSLISFLLNKTAGSFDLRNLGGSLKGTFSLKASNLDLALVAKNFDLGKSGIFTPLTGVQGGAVVDGTLSVNGNLEDLVSLGGAAALKLSRLELPAQTLFGFAIPRIAISESSLDASISTPKVLIKSFSIGKVGSTDDLQGQISGDMTLGKRLDTSLLNLKVHFSLSETVLRSFVLLDTLLGGGKQADQSYIFNIAGSVLAPIPTPP